MGAFLKSIFAHVYLEFNISEPPGIRDAGSKCAKTQLLTHKHYWKVELKSFPTVYGMPIFAQYRHVIYCWKPPGLLFPMKYVPLAYLSLNFSRRACRSPLLSLSLPPSPLPSSHPPSRCLLLHCTSKAAKGIHKGQTWRWCTMQLRRYVWTARQEAIHVNSPCISKGRLKKQLKNIYPCPWHA